MNINPAFKDYEILLGSNSPRRQYLLDMCRIPFSVPVLKDIEEIYPIDLDVKMIPEYLAKLKASFYIDELKPNQILITADTVVCFEDEKLGKQKTPEKAIACLEKISGKHHLVATGVCISTHNKQVSFSEYTDVYFKELSKEDINFYVREYQPFDKAGAYGIQEWIGYVGVKKIEGCYYNVMGLPTSTLHEKLSHFVQSL